MGCAITPPADVVTDHIEPMLLQGRLTDDRAQFYADFCGGLAGSKDAKLSGHACSDFIYAPESGTAASAIRAQARAVPADTVLVFVTGIFGECVKDIATPFADAYPQLLRQGYKATLNAPVDGRSNSTVNAGIIDSYLTKNSTSTDRIILIGYSKGATDAMTALVDFKTSPWVRRVVAFVSVSGVVAGTPVADAAKPLYDTFFESIPLPGCKPEAKGALDSLTMTARQSWLEKNRLPESIAYFSLTAVAQAGHTNPLLVPFRDYMSQWDPLNDGQVPVADAVLPDAHFLGTVKADHWAVALPFQGHPGLESKILGMDNEFPRPELIEAILQEVETDLAKTSGH